MGYPLVSIIIPTFNRAGIVTRAIDSVLHQTYRPVHVIVVDDGSTDETPEVLKAYGSAIVYVRQGNAGPAAARNRGIRESEGDLIAFLDSDDLWLTTKLERQVALLQDAGPAVPCCLCNTLMKMPKRREASSFAIAWVNMREPEGLWLNPAAVLATRFVLFCQAALVRREFLLQCRDFDERLWLMEDHDLALRLALRGPWAFIREPLAVWCGGHDTPGLWAAAMRQPARLYQSIEYIDRKVLGQESIPDLQIRRYLRSDLHRAERKLLAERLVASGRALSRLAALGITGWDRLRRAWFIRSRSWPMPKTKPITAHGESRAQGPDPTRFLPHRGVNGGDPAFP
ncbi:MAG: glycosyltransferase family 2 protein [Planctomycetes bacterium]|nr:glycosyltransferase family 2 protein [Planctomycetota bacterium]